MTLETRDRTSIKQEDVNLKPEESHVGPYERGPLVGNNMMGEVGEALVPAVVEFIVEELVPGLVGPKVGEPVTTNTASTGAGISVLIVVFTDKPASAILELI